MRGSVCRALGIRHYVVDFAADLEEKVIRPFVAEYLPGKDAQPLRGLQPVDQVRFAPGKGAGLGLRRHRHGPLCRHRGGKRPIPAENPEGPAEGSDLFPPCDPEGGSGEGPFPAGRVSRRTRCGASRSGPACPSSTSRRARTSASSRRRVTALFSGAAAAGIEPGEIVDREGRVLGRHRGIACYTIGQRGGLGISSPAPLYVLAIDAAQNRLVVGGEEGAPVGGPGRGSGQPPGRFLPGGGPGQDPLRPPGGALPDFRGGRPPHGPVSRSRRRPSAPGQSVVLYDGETVLGGGIIQEVYRGTR